MQPTQIIKRINSELVGVIPNQSWGETALFYNPGKKLPNGVYFCTIKENDGANDQSSDLSRDQCYRLSIGVPQSVYEHHFGSRHNRPAKGGIVDTGHDFTITNVLMPHPIYAWMSWVCILTPSADSFEPIFELIIKAHQQAVIKFNRKTKSV